MTQILYLTGTEGRAGMAAIVDQNDNLDLSQLNKELQKTLPPYARPLFIRLIKEADLTGKLVSRFTCCKFFHCYPEISTSPFKEN